MPPTFCGHFMPRNINLQIHGGTSRNSGCVITAKFLCISYYVGFRWVFCFFPNSQKHVHKAWCVHDALQWTSIIEFVHAPHPALTGCTMGRPGCILSEWKLAQKVHSSYETCHVIKVSYSTMYIYINNQFDKINTNVIWNKSIWMLVEVFSIVIQVSVDNQSDKHRVYTC